MSNEEKTQAENRPLPKLNQPEAIVFDMDGTLFQTESLLLPAYHKMFDILREEGLHSGPTPPEERILGSLGMLLADIWKNVMPEADEAVHRRADELLLQLEIEGLEAGGTVLYPKVAETLRALHARGVKLFVASNGLEDYIHSIVVVHELKDLFEGCTARAARERLPRLSCSVFCWTITRSAAPGWWGTVPPMYRRARATDRRSSAAPMPVSGGRMS